MMNDGGDSNTRGENNMPLNIDVGDTVKPNVQQYNIIEMHIYIKVTVVQKPGKFIMILTDP